MRQWGLRLLVTGVVLQFIDVVGDGIVFGPEGFLRGIDRSVPKITLPIGEGVETNTAFWMISAGSLMYFAG